MTENAETQTENVETQADKKAPVAMLKQPFVIALIIIGVALVILIATQTSNKGNQSEMSASSGVDASLDTEAENAGIELTPPRLDGSDRNTPSIVKNMNQKPGSVSAPGLDMLLKGLESKVAADPANVGNRILLAQTYNELGMQDKALIEMRALQKEQPEDGRVNLVLGSILSSSSDTEMVKESISVLDKAKTDAGVQQYLVDMYKGDALIRMQDHDGALKHWKAALDNMPLSDNRRAVLEQRISNLSAKPKPANDAQS